MSSKSEVIGEFRFWTKKLSLLAAQIFRIMFVF